MLSKKDIKQIEDQGLSFEKVFKQIDYLTQGIPPVEIVTAAMVGNGVEVIPHKARQKLIDIYESERKGLDIVKFVPASGAATRMFKFLHEFLDDYDPEKEPLVKYLRRERPREVTRFLNSLNDFPFANGVKKKIRENYPDYKRSTKGMRAKIFIKSMLEEQGMDFDSLPKGLIPFHKYAKYATTAFEEQLYEAAQYASVKDEAYIHFTFSEKHLPYFREEFEAVKKRVSKKTKTEFHISYSFQKRSTDTLAFSNENILLRDAQGDLVFRPSGHGALLENLDDVDADVIFIKNIDNVAAEEYIDETAYYKKILAGKLIWLQKKIFAYLELLSKDGLEEQTFKEIRSFLWNELNIKDIPTDNETLFGLLDRPLRVCGVVKNTGDPGGGPFWVKGEDGSTTLQIVEMSQIDMENSHQSALIAEATHFNPVDIVCGIRDYKGDKYELSTFADHSSGFIAQKSWNGKKIKALELPGLWNGAMARWNTVFVEVPRITFNPVKTVNDLLNKEHRPNA